MAGRVMHAQNSPVGDRIVYARIGFDRIADGLGMQKFDLVMIPVDSHIDHAAIPELAARA
jgi:hypothetical protein